MFKLLKAEIGYNWKAYLHFLGYFVIVCTLLFVTDVRKDRFFYILIALLAISGRSVLDSAEKRDRMFALLPLRRSTVSAARSIKVWMPVAIALAVYMVFLRLRFGAPWTTLSEISAVTLIMYSLTFIISAADHLFPGKRIPPRLVLPVVISLIAAAFVVSLLLYGAIKGVPDNPAVSPVLQFLGWLRTTPGLITLGGIAVLFSIIEVCAYTKKKSFL